MKVHEYSDQYFGQFGCSVTRTAFDLCVIHSTETESADATARGLSTRKDCSSHLVVGEGVTYRIVPEKRGSCTVREPNPWTLNIEQIGRASWSPARWLKSIDTVRRAAYWVAVWCLKYDIPPVFRTTADLDAGKKRGWTTHGALALSKWSSSTHSDPGGNYPLNGSTGFKAILQFYLLGLKLGLVKKPREVAR